MSNETSLQNGAVDKGGETKHNTERALLGKIARLPKEIREQLNQRLDDGQPGSEILPWLNELPPVKEVLGKHFRSVPISDTNLCHWRGGGYQRWTRKQEALAELKEFAEDIEDYSGAAGERLARGTAMLAAAKILKRLQTMPEEGCAPEELIKLAFATTALAQVEQNNERLKNEKTRVFQGNERLVLSWDKFLRGCVDTAQRALNSAIAKDIQAADIDNGEKIELLGHELFGKKWQGREIEKKEEAKEPEEPKNGPGEGDELEKPPTQMPPHPGPLPQGGEGDSQPMADQQVRPTVTVGSIRASVKTIMGKTMEKISGGLTTAATPKQKQPANPPHPAHIGTTHEMALAPLVRAPNGGEGNGKARPTTLPNPKQKVPARELSPYEKAILEGKTHLEAMYAQYTPIKSAQPKPQGDTSSPKPNPLDAFSEPVKPSPFASLYGLLRRGSLWGSKVG